MTAIFECVSVNLQNNTIQCLIQFATQKANIMIFDMIDNYTLDQR